jgi:hypothetical protein
MVIGPDEISSLPCGPQIGGRRQYLPPARRSMGGG